jgi:hypothetical protein
MLFSIIASAQHVIKGRLFEKDGKGPIAYASISVQRSMKGTVSNTDGQFRLDVSENKPTDTLTISHIGFESKSFVLKDLPVDSVIELFLVRSAIFLNEITVGPDSENQYAKELFRDVYEVTKKNLAMPFEVQTYCRQLVLQNNQLTKFADARLVSMYKSFKNDILTNVEQIRVVQIPIENNNVIDLANPTRIDKITELAYLEILDRFVDERSVHYTFRQYGDPTSQGYYFLIEPVSQEISESQDESRYRAIVKADQKKNIQEIHFSLDSTTTYSRALLGIKVRVKDYMALLHLRNIDGFNYLYFGKLNVKMDVDFKKNHQSISFVSELINFDINLKNPGSGGSYKKGSKVSSLFKFESKYTYSFWDLPEIPLQTDEDNKLLKELEVLQKAEMAN